MGEPRLEDMSDYNELKGPKKKVLLIVLLVGMLISVAYIFIDAAYGNVKDSIKVEDSIKYVPLK